MCTTSLSSLERTKGYRQSGPTENSHNRGDVFVCVDLLEQRTVNYLRKQRKEAPNTREKGRTDKLFCQAKMI